MQLYTIETGFFKLDGGAMFGVVPKTIWQKLNPPDANNLCTWAMRCLLVQANNHLLLVDCGLGNKQSEQFFSHYQPFGEANLTKSLAAHGFHPDDITDVLLTHLHFDHCGGAVQRLPDGKLAPTFKNAVYWSNEQHWQLANQPNPREKASFLPENFLPLQASGQLQFAAEGVFLHPHIELIFSNGHTQALMMPHVKYKNYTIAYISDLMPSSHHARLPYVMAYDTQPLVTMAEKQALYQRAAAHQNYVLFFEHDPQIACATLQPSEKGGGMVINQTFALEEL